MLESEFKSEQILFDFRSSILTSFFCNFWKVQNITNFEYSVNLECLETPVIDPKTPVIDPKTLVFP